ncbi:MAG: response regulator transcription factor [Eubacteriales bacterium]
MEQNVLIIEDERTIVDILKFNLMRNGYTVQEALDGETGLKLAKEQNPDLILLDVMLPKMNGFDLCRNLRDCGFTMPILMLTAREEENDKIFGLEAGADDYITKPFSMQELLARVKANIRRTAMVQQPAVAPIKEMGFTLDAGTCTAMRDGTAILLTQKEFDLVRFLMASPDTVFSREELLEKVWNYDYFGDMRTVDVTVRRLREKIEADPGKPQYIITRRGMGYYFAGNI